MRCSFCGRRIRGDYAELVKRTGGKLFYHHAEPDSQHPHRHCSAAALNRGERLCVRPTIYTDQLEEVKT